jgi:hypothetical protein
MPYRCDSSLGVFSVDHDVVGSSSRREQAEKPALIKHIRYIYSVFIFDNIYR